MRSDARRPYQWVAPCRVRLLCGSGAHFKEIGRNAWPRPEHTPSPPLSPRGRGGVLRQRLLPLATGNCQGAGQVDVADGVTLLGQEGASVERTPTAVRR